MEAEILYIGLLLYLCDILFCNNVSVLGVEQWADQYQ